jgi:hypothetical protein
MAEVIQIVGAIAILAGFALAQFGYVDQRSYSYLLLNLVGAAILAVSAYIEKQWGFVILEVVWTLVSAWGLASRLRARSAESPA